MAGDGRDIRYAEVLDLLREAFPEMWDDHLAWLLGEDGGEPLVHSALGAVVSQAGDAMRAGDPAMAERLARLANLLVESEDPRVDNAVHVSFFEVMDHLDPADLEHVSRGLSARAEAALAAMLPGLRPFARAPRAPKGKARAARKRARRKGRA